MFGKVLGHAPAIGREDVIEFDEVTQFLGMAQEGGCQQQAAEGRCVPGAARIRAAQQGHPFRIAIPFRFDHHDKDAFWQGHRLRIGFPWPRSSLDYEAMTPADARDAFTRLLQTPEPELDLAEAALLIAAEEYPDLRPSVYLEQIARMGTELKRRIRAEVEPRRVVETANTYLFEELHFKGNREEYYDPRNSFLNDVIERRVGIPITLAVLYIAIGERAGLPVRGVGMPGHFLVKYAPASSGEIFIDAFNGRTLSRQECAKMLEDMYGGTVKMRPALLEPSTKRQILARILNNLKSLYLSRGDLARALAASDRIMLTDPHLTSEWRDRGLIQFQMRHDTEALKDFSRYLGVRPEPEDAARVKQLRGQLISRLN
ncbi:MAG: tetratricopeptide repeat protein [Chloroflexi bacterium]|nr:MAG: tetratricopeptide repeat protein [Chloroflexota bacterium]TMG43163.1 MAG: tetratricopeptide repeat protein [Chloroflexota bacterium]